MYCVDRQSLEKYYGEGFDEEADGDDFGGLDGGSVDDEEEDNGDEDVVDEDNEYLEYLAQQAANHSSDAEFDEFDEEIEEELLFESPLDEIDPYVRFSDVFKGNSIKERYRYLGLDPTEPWIFCVSIELQTANPASYTLLTKDLDQEQQTLIMSIMSTAEQHRIATA